MSFSRITPRQSSPQSRQHQLSRSCLRRRLIRLTPGWSLVWPGRVVTSPAYRARPPILLANGSNFYARSSPVPDNPYVVFDVRQAEAAARRLGLETASLEIRRADDIAPAFEELKGRAEALYILPDPLLFTHRLRINTLALGARLPTMHSLREYVEASGLMSYGPNWSDQWRHAADYVDKILRGAKPADLPVEQPTKFDLIIN